MRVQRPPSARRGGFTLLELTVVLGLLGAFSVFLVQMLTSGVELFDEGQSSQELADLGNTASGATRGALAAMVGPRRQAYEEQPPDARLLVQWVPLGLVPGESADGRVQALRATVAIPPAVEERLLRRRLRPLAEQTAETMEEADVEVALVDLLVAAPRTGRAEMLLLPWPAGDPDDAFLELRRGLWLADEEIVLDQRRVARLMEIEELGDDGMPPRVVAAESAVIASGLLHFELSFWSQYTKDFDREPGGEGPELCWDSARAGWSVEFEERERQFSLDLGDFSLTDATDDVFPRAVRVTLVVARQGQEAQLAADLAPGAVELPLRSLRPLGDLPDAGYLKVGSEWVRYTGVRGTTLTGLVRGARHTAARAHSRGTRVRAGKEVSFVLELAHGRDNWNG